MFELKVTSFFSAAHFLREYKGKCEAVHGHNWRVQATVKSKELNPQGLVLDFNELKSELSAVLDELDHKDLNQIGFFKTNNPSSENIAQFIYRKLLPLFKERGVALSRVSVWEQRDYSASYSED